MTQHAQKPVALILELEPNAVVASLQHRIMERLVASVRLAIKMPLVLQASAGPFSIAHPWRRWRWFS